MARDQYALGKVSEHRANGDQASQTHDNPSCLNHFKLVRQYFPEPFHRNVLGGCLYILAKVRKEKKERNGTTFV